jgi:hypothetical protein
VLMANPIVGLNGLGVRIDAPTTTKTNLRMAAALTTTFSDFLEKSIVGVELG